MPKKTIFAAFALLLPLAGTAVANHGPGTSGGGSATTSGETLAPGAWELSLREDYTNFENVDRANAERRAIRAGGFDAIQESYITTLGLSYGIVDDLQISAAIGYYRGNGFIDAAADGGIANSSTADPEGQTDLTLQLKYRILQGKPGNLSIIGGLIVPTGKDNVHLASGEMLEPSSQPGTGAFAFQCGLAYSRFLTSHMTIDASAIYTLRIGHNNFEVGDRLDLGVALAYRLTDSIKQFPNYSLFGELNGVWLGKDDGAEGANSNSGGWTVYLTPGARVRFNEAVSLTVAPSFPIYQDLNGEQIEARFKLAATLSFAF